MPYTVTRDISKSIGELDTPGSWSSDGLAYRRWRWDVERCLAAPVSSRPAWIHHKSGPMFNLIQHTIDARHPTHFVWSLCSKAASFVHTQNGTAVLYSNSIIMQPACSNHNTVHLDMRVNDSPTVCLSAAQVRLQQHGDLSSWSSTMTPECLHTD